MLVLSLRNDDSQIIVDEADWPLVKIVAWKLIDGQVVNGCGITYEEFVGLPSYLTNRYGNTLDKRREFLIPDHMEYTYSEYHGRCIVKAIS